MTPPTPDMLQQLGASLREIDPSHLVQDDESGLKVRWFLGDNATELYAWAKPDGTPDHLQLVFAHVSVEWSAEKGLATGTFKTGSSTAGGRYDPYLMQQRDVVDHDVCVAAVALLKASQVDPVLAQPLLAALNEVASRPAPPRSSPPR